MIKKEIKKKKINPLIKANRAINPKKDKYLIINQKKNEQTVPKNKIIKKKARARSISAVRKDEPKKEKININYGVNNSLELDYLNFSKLDIFKLDQSFEDDIFNPNYNSNNRKKLILNRYEDSSSTLNDYSNMINNNKNNEELENIEKSKDKEYLSNTPSTICNYYEQSSNKKKSSNKKEISKFNYKPNEQMKKNLEDVYNSNSSNNKEKINDENEKGQNKQKANIMKKINLIDDILFPDDINKANNINNKKNEIYKDDIKNKNHENNNNNFYSNFQKKEKIDKRINKNQIKNEEIKTFDLNIVENKINENNLNGKIKIRKVSQQKPTNICYNQNKNEAYFITPRNINKVKNDKNLSSTKSTKVNTNSIGKAKSFSSKKVKYNNSNLIYLNKNKNQVNEQMTNYKIIKELIKDNKEMLSAKKNLNKTAQKNKNINLDNKNNSNCLIKVNLKSKTKSSSNLNTSKKQIITKENKLFNRINNKINNKNDINSKIKSEIKNSFTIFQNIYKTINKSGIKSPDKDDATNLFKISKTLTEQNIVHKNDATPKNYKIQKFDSIPFTTIVKKIFIGSSKKDNLIKFDSSMKKKEQTKTEQMKSIFKPKTQSDFKAYNNIIGNEFFKKSGNNGLNFEYGNDKHVKQKLLDRMNKATNNWHYIFKVNKNKKNLDEGISNLKSQNKEHYNYFYKNENIISDGSEKEDDDGNI